MRMEPPHVLSCVHRHLMDKNNIHVDGVVGADLSRTPPIHRPTWISRFPHQQKETPPLLKEKTYPSSEKSRNTHVSRVKTYKTPAGPLFLRACCTPSFVEGLKAD